MEGELFSTPTITALVLSRDIMRVEPVETKCQPNYDSAVYRRKHHPCGIMTEESIGACCIKKKYKEVAEKKAVMVIME